FIPHLTIGRVAGPRGVGRLTEALRDWTAGTAAETLAELILYRSQLTPGGPRYAALGRHPLTGALPA
ncbi:MAG: 2'-5' RNA ligase family protein, partial [Gemmatimonadota bacterium]